MFSLSCLRWCSVSDVWSHVHHQILCIGVMNCPTCVVAHQLGHIACMALLHSWKPPSVGCLLGHCILDHVLAGGRQDNISGLIFCPDAVSKSDKKRTCSTQLSIRSLSFVNPSLMRTCMMNRSPSLGYFSWKSATTNFRPNNDTFSHSIFIQECVRSYSYCSYNFCSGCNDRPISMRNRECDAFINRPTAVLHL